MGFEHQDDADAGTRRPGRPEPIAIRYSGPQRLEDLPPMSTAKEVSVACRRSLSGVYEDIRSGPLKGIAVHWGRRVYIDRDALIELIKGGEL